MSLETWKAEFYPRRADQVFREEAVEHSIRKWEGLRPDNRFKHEVSFVIHPGGRTIHNALVDETGAMFDISVNSCALCRFHNYKINQKPRCVTCPLAITLGYPCDDDTLEGVVAPWWKFLETGYADAMLDALYLARFVSKVREAA